MEFFARPRSPVRLAPSWRGAHGLRPQRASDHGFEDAWTDPNVLFVGGGAKPTLDLLGDSAVLAFLADRGSRARWVCSVCTGSLLLGAAGLLRGYRAAVHWGAREALKQFRARRDPAGDDEYTCVAWEYLATLVTPTGSIPTLNLSHRREHR